MLLSAQNKKKNKEKNGLYGTSFGRDEMTEQSKTPKNDILPTNRRLFRRLS